MSAGGGSGAATAVVEITVVDRSGDRLALDVALDGEAAATPRALFEMVADAIDAPTTSFKLWYAHAGATWRLHNAVKLPALIRDKGVNMFYLSDADQTAFQIQDRDANITSKAQKPAQPPMSKAVRVKLLVDGKLQKNYRIMATEADFSKERFVFRCAKELGLGDVASMRVTVVDPADNQTYEIPGNDIGEEISSGFCFQFERNTTVHDHASEGSWDAAGPTADALDETTLQILQGEEDPTWICYEGQRRHEFFFSHRQVSEAGLIEGLYNALAEYGHQAYWDRVCIRPGKAFRTEFLRGLSSSRFAALFISEFTLTQIRTAHQRQDNVLLEWELALELHRLGKIEILPILVGKEVKIEVDRGRVENRFTPFSSFGTSDYPEELHAHSMSPRRHTVREVVSKIFELQGLPCDPRPGKLKSFITSLQRQLAQAENGQRPAPRAMMTELRQWLNPLDDVMNKQMEVHLHAFVPGTRQWLIDRLSSGLFTLDDSKKRMIWLKGPAGVGKSVMAALVAEHHKSKNQLAGVFFCKHDDERRRDIRQVILTIVHYLCVWDGDNYGQLIHAALRKTPDLVKKPVSDLFDELLRKPLGSLKKSNPRPLLIVVDALDECGTINERNEMLDLFGRRCRDLPPFVKIFMTSRLEPDIVDAFADMPQSALEPTDADNRRDLRIYAADFLEKQEVSEEVAKSGADRLVELSEGIFAWMVLACKSLEGSGHASISMRDIETLVFDSSSSGASMDSLLSSTFERIFSAPGLDESLLTTLIGMLCIGQELLSAADWAKLLGKDTAAVTSCVRHLQSLLVIENDPETDSPTIRFYHKSVADYLRDPVRCTVEILRMDSEKLCHYHGLLGLRCLRVMNRDLGFNILAMPLDVVASLASLPRSSIGKVPLALRYASTHVAIHLEAAESAIIPLGTDIISNVSSLASTHLTHWMEFLSICGRYESIIHSNLSLTALLTKLQVELGQEENVQASQLLEEGYKFSLLFRVPIIANPFQLYKSAMAACPKKSAFFRVYGHTTEAVACAKLEYMAGLKDKWSPAVATLEGHRRGINSLEVSRDSRRLLTRGNDKTVRLWETETGRELHVLAPFSSWVGAAVFSPNGKRVAVGSVEISIWDAMSGRQLLLLHGHKGQIRCLEYSADGSFLLSGCEGSSVRLWAAGTGEPIHVMEGHSGFIRCAKFAKDQQRIFSADANGLVIVWDVATGSLLKKLVGHTGGVRALDFSGDGKLLATASTDRTVRIWSTETYATLLVLEGHADAVRTVHFSSDGGRLVAGDQTVRVWDTTSGQCLFTQADHVGTIFCALFSPDGKLLVSGGSDRKIRVLNAKTGALIRMMTGHTGAVNDMAFFRSGRSLASGAGDTSARIWNLQGIEEDDDSDDENGLHGALKHVRVSEDETILAGVLGGDVKLIDTSTGHHLRTLHDTDFVKILAFSQDGSMLAVGLANGVVKLYILPSGEPIAALSGHEAEIISAQFSRNGQQLASGDGSGKACLWDLETRNVVWTLPHSRTVTSVDFNADGTKLACSCFGNELRVWNTQTGQELHSLTPNAPKYAIFSADGAWMACISFGSGHRVYNVETGDFLRNPAGFPRDVSSMEFVGDGKLLIRDTKGRSFHWDFGSGASAVRETDERRLRAWMEDDWLAVAGPGGLNERIWTPRDVRGHRVLCCRDVVFLFGRGFAMLRVVGQTRDEG